jgi:RimJ/RimL family protein N-acetyltransferase
MENFPMTQATKASIVSHFPKAFAVNNVDLTLRLMTRQDRNAILHFAQHLDEVDLAFMRRDITQPEAVEHWIEDIEQNRAITILVESASGLLGYGTLYYNQFFWNRHLAEIRILVSSPYRNWGLGTRLTSELMLIGWELGLDKVMMYMRVDDPAARRMAEHLGLRAEAILTDWIKTRDDSKHDLLIMSTSLADIRS